MSYFYQVFRRTQWWESKVAILWKQQRTAKHVLLLRMWNDFLILSCTFIGNTCLGASSVSFNSEKFVRGLTKYCLNKMQFSAPAPESHWETSCVDCCWWVAYNASLNVHSLPTMLEYLAPFCELVWEGTTLLLLGNSQKCNLNNSWGWGQCHLSFGKWSFLGIGIVACDYYATMKVPPSILRVPFGWATNSWQGPGKPTLSHVSDLFGPTII